MISEDIAAIKIELDSIIDDLSKVSRDEESSDEKKYIGGALSTLFYLQNRLGNLDSDLSDQARVGPLASLVKGLSDTGGRWQQTHPDIMQRAIRLEDNARRIWLRLA